MRKIEALGAALLLLSVPAAGITAPERASLGAFTLEVDAPNGVDAPERFRVLKSGRKLYEHRAIFRIQMGKPCCGDSATITPGKDVNGNGIPDVVLFEWNGGAVSCCSIRVIEMSDPIREIAYVGEGRFDPAFINADEDSALEVDVREPVFDYWPDVGAASPFPRITLDWTETGLAPSCSLTFRPLDPGEFEDRLVQILNSEGRPFDHPTWETYAALCRAMVDFYYIGQKESALRLFDESILPGDAYALNLLVELGTRLERSYYWKDLSGCATPKSD